MLSLAKASSPTNFIHLKPGDDIQAIVNASPIGASFLFETGVYNNVSITPKDNQTFVGDGKVVLSGASDISGWTLSNGVWSTSGFPASSLSHGDGRDGMAQYVEDLLVNGTPYLRVANLADLGAGKFYYENGKAYISDNPTGKHTAFLNMHAAFVGNETKSVTISNMTVENYASMAQHGAIEAHDTKDWKLINVTAIGNHGAGVAAGDGMQILGGIYSNNGQIGIHAYDTEGLVIDGAKVSNNNYAGFSTTWDAGGIKILTSSNVIVKNTEISENHGFGLWFDWDNKNVDVYNNFLHSNAGPGLFYEASYDCVIHDNNFLFNNTDGYADGYWGSDLLVNESSRVEIRGNEVSSDVGQGIGIQQSKRDPGIYGEHASAHNTVSGNKIIMVKEGLNGAALDTGGDGGNVWDGNTYIADSEKSLFFTWANKFYTAEGRSQLPIEQHGSFVYTADPAVMARAGFLHPVSSTTDAAPPLQFDPAGATGEILEDRRAFGGRDYHSVSATADWGSQTVRSAPASWTADYATHLAFDNFVQVNLDLHAAGKTALDIMVVGAMNGAITTGSGDDTVTWVADSNRQTGNNTMAIATGDGNDTVHITAAGFSSLADQHRTGNGALYNPTYSGRYSVADVQTGSGRDTVTVEGGVHLVLHSGTGFVTSSGGSGTDWFYIGKGGADLTGGGGIDSYIVQRGSGHTVIEDFASGIDHLKFIGIKASEMRSKAATEGGVSGLLITYDNAGDSVFLAHVTKLPVADMIFA